MAPKAVSQTSTIPTPPLDCLHELHARAKEYAHHIGQTVELATDPEGALGQTKWAAVQGTLEGCKSDLLPQILTTHDEALAAAKQANAAAKQHPDWDRDLDKARRFFDAWK